MLLKSKLYLFHWILNRNEWCKAKKEQLRIEAAKQEKTSGFQFQMIKEIETEIKRGTFRADELKKIRRTATMKEGIESSQNRRRKNQNLILFLVSFALLVIKQSGDSLSLPLSFRNSQFKPLLCIARINSSHPLRFLLSRLHRLFLVFCRKTHQQLQLYFFGC